MGGALTNLGEVYRAEGDLAKAEGLFREALGIFRKLGRKDNEYATMNNLGGVLYQRGDFRGARKSLKTYWKFGRQPLTKLEWRLLDQLADVLRIQANWIHPLAFTTGADNVQGGR